MPPKLASPYSMVKKPLQQTNIYSLFDAKDKQTNEIWLAKVIHHIPVEKLSLTDHIAYNEEVLQNLTNKQTVIYVKQIFYKQNDTFIIQQKYQKKLSSYLQSKRTIQSMEVEKIIQDTYRSVCDIYEQGYIHRNIRPQHIVYVPGDSQSDGMWKIQSFVYNNQEFPIDSPFTWKKQTASLEEKMQKEELDDDLMDAQIVWNFGYLSVQMLMGDQFFSKKMSRDSEIPWGKIKEKCLASPNVFQLIQKCFRFKFQDRLSLKKFFDLKIFENCGRQGFNQYFLTASRIFKTKTFSSIQMSMNLKSMNMKSMNMKSKIQKTLATPPKVAHYTEEAIQQENDEEKDLHILRSQFLPGVSKYLSLLQTNEPANRANQNRLIIQFYFLRLAQLSNQKYNRINDSQINSQTNNLLNSKSKIVKRIKSTENNILKKFDIDMKVSYTPQQQRSIFNKLCGYAYTKIKQSCEKSERDQLIKALAYFGLAALFVNIQEIEKLIPYFQGGLNKNYLQIFQKQDSQRLLNFSQKLIREIFQIV